MGRGDSQQLGLLGLLKMGVRALMMLMAMPEKTTNPAVFATAASSFESAFSGSFPFRFGSDIVSSSGRVGRARVGAGRNRREIDEKPGLN